MIFHFSLQISDHPRRALVIQATVESRVRGALSESERRAPGTGKFGETETRPAKFARHLARSSLQSGRKYDTVGVMPIIKYAALRSQIVANCWRDKDS